MTTHLPFSQACENNKGPILERLRDIDDLSVLAEAVGLVLREDYAMPANNEMLVFGRAGQAIRIKRDT